MSERERFESTLFYGLCALATLAWWLWMWREPEARPDFLGSEFAAQWPFLLLFPDALALIGGAAWLAWACLLDRFEKSALAWIYFGAAGYGWAVTAVLATRDPRAYWGFVAMSALVSMSLLFALRLSGVSLLWGPFRFQSSSLSDERDLRRASLRQRAAMGSIFIAALPAVLALGEHALGWSGHWLDAPTRWVPAVLIFAAGATLASWGEYVMVHEGKGTALPSSCATKLVTSGPYRWLRNPMACGSLAQGLAVGLLIGSPVVLLYALSGVVAWEVLVRHEEEAYLQRTFGQAFVNYRRRVDCWWPLLVPRR